MLIDFRNYIKSQSVHNMFDVFYIGFKPGLFPHEQSVNNIQQAQHLCRTRFCWVISSVTDYKTWDWDWEPSYWQKEYTHVWPSQNCQYLGTYLIPKTHEIKFHFHDEILPNRDRPEDFIFKLDAEFDTTWSPHPMDPPYIYVFGNQWYPGEEMPTVEYHVPGARDKKFIQDIRAKIKPNMSRWVIPDNVDIRDFDFSWIPHPNDPPYIYQFGTKWQKTGGPQYHVPGATEFKYIEEMQVAMGDNYAKFFFIDHFNEESDQKYCLLQEKYSDIERVRYVDNYYDIIKKICTKANGIGDFVWIVSSICDYSDFDFSWHPEVWQYNMVHVFASNDQKFGDTFLINVARFLKQSQTRDSLEDFELNFVNISVPRLPPPVIEHNKDSHVDVVLEKEFRGPIAIYKNNDLTHENLPTVSLWSKKTRAIVPVTNSGSTMVFVKDAIPYIKTQIYDYPYINKTHKKISDFPLDVVFISNGEPNAEENFQHLQQQLQNCTNRLTRVDRVSGRVQAYHAAARASNTAWAFCVFAKLKVNDKFDWNWQPDFLQQPKHYIFHARNPVNGLEYGHQAIIAYNKKMTLSNLGHGLDFTLDQPHEVVPILSGVAFFNIDPWTAWRTAFREVLKLRSSLPDTVSEQRLQQWSTQNLIGDSISHYAILGANDALDYYSAVNGDPDKLKLSYEWKWLADYAVNSIGRLVSSDIR